jgi:hypothetical protein
MNKSVHLERIMGEKSLILNVCQSIFLEGRGREVQMLQGSS